MSCIVCLIWVQQAELVYRMCHLAWAWRLGKGQIGLTRLGQALFVTPGVGLKIRVGSWRLTSRHKSTGCLVLVGPGRWVWCKQLCVEWRWEWLCLVQESSDRLPVLLCHMDELERTWKGLVSSKWRENSEKVMVRISGEQLCADWIWEELCWRPQVGSLFSTLGGWSNRWRSREVSSYCVLHPAFPYTHCQASVSPTELHAWPATHLFLLQFP